MKNSRVGANIVEREHLSSIHINPACSMSFHLEFPAVAEHCPGIIIPSISQRCQSARIVESPSNWHTARKLCQDRQATLYTPKGELKLLKVKGFPA